ncbi:MAG: hypothetical protein L3J59_15785 [Methylococcaceae bacterium]|nr:hypothetical protein [Methylococcaceae bacterium]
MSVELNSSITLEPSRNTLLKCRFAGKTSLTKSMKENLGVALTYFVNHRHMMGCATQRKNQLSIGSWITEAACKTLIKQRLFGSGMRWRDKGAKVILSLRALVQSKGRWQKFWCNSEQYGVQVYL